MEERELRMEAVRRRLGGESPTEIAKELGPVCPVGAQVGDPGQGGRLSRLGERPITCSHHQPRSHT